MTQSPGPFHPLEPLVPSGDSPVPVITQVAELGKLLEELDHGWPAGAAAPVVDEATDNQLVQVRLGTAASLYAALRVKNASLAAHSLRVALGSSAWSRAMGRPDRQRDTIEVAALLHDIGLIAVPDHVLLKPGPLDRDEARIVEQSRKMSVEVLRASCAQDDLLEVVENIPAWFDGSRGGYRVAGGEIPLGARMINVVEAFDAMTIDHVYRPAMPLERATAELFHYAGTQFDPALVKDFLQFHAGDQQAVRREVAARWLRLLDPETVNSYWELTVPTPRPSRGGGEAVFEGRLLDNMHDAVIFINAGGHVVRWNHGAERLTGISESSVCHRRWSATLLNMRGEQGRPISDEDCPVHTAIRSGVQSLRRLTIWGRTGQPVAVDSHTIPVTDDQGAILGAVLLLHDASSETSLEERCQSLHEKATRDPMTQVANRAEFNRVHQMFINAHREQQVPCSLMICDLDHFKQVNDTFGHQAGDEAIISLATLLKKHCRPGDLVARYGGEEFVMLFAGCDNATAARRSEQIRKALSEVSQAKMNGRTVTASFGVTEIQPGDTAETMLRRADRGLLTAKSRGRNTVVQLGSGSGGEEEATAADSAVGPQPPADLVIRQDLLTPVPVGVAVEKLRGFVADHQAKIISIEANQVRLLTDQGTWFLKRRSDRPVPFTMALEFEEELCQPKEGLPGAGPVSRTRIQVTVAPWKNRDRRRADIESRAREFLASLRSYLMAAPESTEQTGGVIRRAKSNLTPWLVKR